jgi:hypothetical protein
VESTFEHSFGRYLYFDTANFRCLSPGGTCTKSVDICGTQPSVFGLSSPEQNAEFDLATVSEIPFAWNAPANWGVPCPPPNANHFEIFIKGPNDTDFRSLFTTNVATNPPTSQNIHIGSIGGEGTYEWFVRARNKQDADDDPSTYRDSVIWEFSLMDYGDPWYTVTDDGDAFASSFSTRPPPSGVNPVWSPGYMVWGQGAPLSSGNIDAVEISESGRYVLHAPTADFWPKLFRYESFTPPPHAVPLTSFLSLDPGVVYYTSSPISGTVTYRLISNGVATVYYTGSQDITIDRIRYSPSDEIESAGRKLLIVTNANITVSSTWGYLTPGQSETPNIRAGIITTGNATLLGSTGSQQGQDTSIVVEGPFVARGTVALNRDRTYNVTGGRNTYPANIVRYNFRYLYGLTSQERSSDVPNYTGLFKFEIIWEGER